MDAVERVALILELVVASAALVLFARRVFRLDSSKARWLTTGISAAIGFLGLDYLVDHWWPMAVSIVLMAITMVLFMVWYWRSTSSDVESWM